MRARDAARVGLLLVLSLGVITTIAAPAAVAQGGDGDCPDSDQATCGEDDDRDGEPFISEGQQDEMEEMVNAVIGSLPIP